MEVYSRPTQTTTEETGYEHDKPSQEKDQHKDKTASHSSDNAQKIENPPTQQERETTKEKPKQKTGIFSFE